MFRFNIAHHVHEDRLLIAIHRYDYQTLDSVLFTSLEVNANILLTLLRHDNLLPALPFQILADLIDPRGENAGSTLTNYHIVRHFESLGTWKGQTVDFSLGPDVVADYAGRPDQDMAVLVQTEGLGPIIAAERLGTGRP